MCFGVGERSGDWSGESGSYGGCQPWWLRQPPMVRDALASTRSGRFVVLASAYGLCMRILAGAVLALVVLAGCSSSEPSADAPTVEVCPPEHSGLSRDLASALDAAVESNPTETVSRSTDPGEIDYWAEQEKFRPTQRRIPVTLVLEIAQWADRHPGCFSDTAAVKVDALRETLAGKAAQWTPSDEDYDAVVTALRTPWAK
jgi:hypothetical protein